MPTVKVSEDIHARLRDLAHKRGTTIGGVINQSLDVMEEAEFWAQVERTMAPETATEEFRVYNGTLKDGFDPDEDWSYLL